MEVYYCIYITFLFCDFLHHAHLQLFCKYYMSVKMIQYTCWRKKHDADKLPVAILGEQWIIFQMHVTDWDWMSHCQLSAAPQQSTEQERLRPWWSGSSHDDKEGREEHAELMSQMSLLICSVNCISSDLVGSVWVWKEFDVSVDNSNYSVNPPKIWLL